MSASVPARQPHVVHLLYRFAAGGLENVVVQLVNGLPRTEFRHTVIALTGIDDGFARRIERADVELIALNKPPGQPYKMYSTMYRLLRQLRPDVLHTCNLAAMEFAPVAALAGVPLRIHAEHGWDVADPDGTNRRYQLIRRVYRRFVHQFVAVSEQLRDYLLDRIGVPPDRVHLIPNGVDTDRFRPWQTGDLPPHGWPFKKRIHWVVGTVGRLEPIKNQVLLAKAFVRLVRSRPAGSESLRLVIVGDGQLKDTVRQTMVDAGLEHRLWLPGARADIPDILRAMDCFVLPSLAEGTSCTLQEAMSTALPIVATDVGGNAALLAPETQGLLVPSGNVDAMADALQRAFVAAQQPIAARNAMLRNYSLTSVLSRYRDLFRGV
jgi:sugar transferase (PEP-CTERM/EpsH1 system associated)